MVHVLVTGPPGVGKTTLVKAVSRNLKEKHNVTVSGFVTQEVRACGRRLGFDLVSLSDPQQRSVLARVDAPWKGPKVGSYTVNVPEFEKAALTALAHNYQETSLLVIDEIGKMELLSARFSSAVLSLFEKQNAHLLCTVPVPRGQPLPVVETVKKSAHSIFHVSKDNRDVLVAEVTDFLLTSLRKT